MLQDVSDGSRQALVDFATQHAKLVLGGLGGALPVVLPLPVAKPSCVVVPIMHFTISP